MKSYVIYNASGEILRAGKNDSDISQNNQGEFELECDWPDDLENYIVENGVLSLKSQSEIESTQAAKNMHKLRSTRDALLTACDWTQTPDSPLSEAQQQSWRDYRQALRDLPANTSDPANPTWPTPPV